MYLAFDKDNKVVDISNTKFVRLVNTAQVEYNAEIPKNDWLTVGNIQEKTRIIKEAYDETIEFDEKGKLLKKPKVIHHEAVMENYLECTELVPHFRTYTEQETAQQKQAKYESLVEKYIREKYSLSNELAILRQANTKYTEFYEYNTYAEECKARAKTEVYGDIKL